MLICLTVQPSVLAASLRFLYSDVHADTPQLMKSIRFPAGIGLPIGWLTGIWVGRCAHCAASLSAVVSSPFDDALLPAVDELPLLPLLPQAVTATAAMASSAERTASRAGRDQRLMMDAMGFSSVCGLWVLIWWTRAVRRPRRRAGAAAWACRPGPRSRRGRRSARRR